MSGIVEIIETLYWLCQIASISSLYLYLKAGRAGDLWHVNVGGWEVVIGVLA